MRWIKLNRIEENNVWGFVYYKLKFSPDSIPGFVTMAINPPAFVLPEPFRIYDMRQLSDAYELSADKKWAEKIDTLFEKMIVTCMCGDNIPLFNAGKRADYVYALDWHHTCYRYYPLKQSRGQKDNYRRVDFFPDGDYQFFLAADFSWGYLAHPWQQGIYAYGHSIVAYLDEYADELMLTLNYKS